MSKGFWFYAIVCLLVGLFCGMLMMDALYDEEMKWEYQRGLRDGAQGNYILIVTPAETTWVEKKEGK